MRRSAVLATLCWWFAVCSVNPDFPNTVPLIFGMTQQGAADALGVPLALVAHRHGADIYVAERRAAVPGLYPVYRRVYLKFSHGRLTGWKNDWGMPPPWF